jgi:hypothetical protein
MSSVDNMRNIEIADISVIMSTKGGRKFIRRVLDYSGVFCDTFDSDTHEHAKNAGRRQVGLWLINEIKEAAPDEYITLIKERNDDD